MESKTTQKVRPKRRRCTGIVTIFYCRPDGQLKTWCFRVPKSRHPNSFAAEERLSTSPRHYRPTHPSYRVPAQSRCYTTRKSARSACSSYPNTVCQSSRPQSERDRHCGVQNHTCRSTRLVAMDSESDMKEHCLPSNLSKTLSQRSTLRAPNSPSHPVLPRDIAPIGCSVTRFWPGFFVMDRDAKHADGATFAVV